MTTLLDARDLTVNYPLQRSGWFGPQHQLCAVDRVSLTLTEGEALGLVGESGCGKSSLARTLCRIADPTSGEIIFANQNIASIPAKDFARSPHRAAIQMVFQDGDSLAPHLTAFELIADPVRRLLRPASSAELRAFVHHAASAVDLPEQLLDRLPHQLSAGQKARVGIARAVAVRPRLLILDEPTAALDVSVQATVLHLLDRLRRDMGMALLFISHDISVVRLLCQRISVMHQGQIVEEGTTTQITSEARHPYTRALLAAVPSLPQTG